MKNQSKTRKILLSAMMLFFMFLILYPTHVEAAGNVKFNPTRKTIYVGDSCTLNLVNNNKNVKWSVSNKNIKILSKNNKQVKIKGINKGTAYINAKIGTKTYKCKITVNYKPQLSPGKKSIKVGDATTIKILNAKGKVKWSVSNGNIRITKSTNSYAKIKGIKKGTSYLNAKVGNKTYRCKITVKGLGVKSIDGIEYELQDTGKGVVAILKNKNKYHVSVDAKIAYFRNGKMIGTASDQNYAFEKGRTCTLFFHAPYNSNYQEIEYDDFKLSLFVEKGTNLICATGKIKVSSNFGADNVSVTVKNNSGKKLEFITIACVFYDSYGKAIGYEYKFAECKKNKSVDYLSFNFPYDEDYQTIRPKKYKIYVNNAYTYTWMH